MKQYNKFYIGDKIFDKWFCSEWRVEGFVNSKAILKSTEEEGKRLILSKSMLQNEERFIRMKV